MLRLEGILEMNHSWFVSATSWLSDPFHRSSALHTPTTSKLFPSTMPPERVIHSRNSARGVPPSFLIPEMVVQAQSLEMMHLRA
jgi:hypothetical protein